jgi:hypothetical protein
LVEVWCLNANDGTETAVRKGRFNNSQGLHYHPKWAKPYCNYQSCGLLTRFPNEANLELNVGKKTLALQKKTLDEEHVLSDDEHIATRDIQRLMKKNRTLALTNPLEFVANHFELSGGASLKAAIMHASGTGFYAVVDATVFDCHLYGTIQQLGHMRPEQRPVHALKQRMTVYNLELDTLEETWIYKNKSGDIIALTVAFVDERA